MLRQLRSFCIPCVTTIVLGSFSNVFAQQSYKILDLGVNKSTDNFNMVMGLNNEGWAENMDGVVNPPITSTSTTVASGRAVISIYGINIDLGTLGGDNSWTNYGGINDRGEAVGMAETSVPDSERLRHVRLWHKENLSWVSLAARPDNGSPDAGRT